MPLARIVAELALDLEMDFAFSTTNADPWPQRAGSATQGEDTPSASQPEFFPSVAVLRELRTKQPGTSRSTLQSNHSGGESSHA